MGKRGGKRLVIFVKAPAPGRVKTRLAQSIGEEEACAAYRELVERLLANLSELRDVELRFAPDEASGELGPWLQEKWELAPQGTGDLGERLARAFREKFDEGISRVVVIGSDCPYVTTEDIETGWRALEAHDVVLGPALDGGYWLIGMRSMHEVLFREVPWSGPAVLGTTLARAGEAGLSVALLRKLSDVDDAVDWRRFRGGVLFDNRA